MELADPSDCSSPDISNSLARNALSSLFGSSTLDLSTSSTSLSSSSTVPFSLAVISNRVPAPGVGIWVSTLLVDTAGSGVVVLVAFVAGRELVLLGVAVVLAVDGVLLGVVDHRLGVVGVTVLVVALSAPADQHGRGRIELPRPRAGDRAQAVGHQ